MRPLAFGVAALGLAAALPASVDAKNFTLRIGAGQAMKPLEPIFMANKHFVPTVKARVEKETGHKIRFIEAYGGTVAGPFDVLESVEKGLFDIGLLVRLLRAPPKGRASRVPLFRAVRDRRSGAAGQDHAEDLQAVPGMDRLAREI